MLWDQVPPDVQAAVLVQALKRRGAALEVRLGQDVSNFSKPPSSDPIHVKRRPPLPPTGERRGGQWGHQRHTCDLVPPGRLTAVVDCRPAACPGCGHELAGDDAGPTRHQVAERPEVRPDVVEYRFQTLRSFAAGLKSVARSLLESGAASGCAWTARVCRALLSAEAHLWAFAGVAGVPPHNNAAEGRFDTG